ncbi:hypothetical protein DMN91_008153 [Ooceraea biroi]|uniref:Fatty acyl-CoA reductase n=1 Tax=Ooceraea biroi TaxID=2015173 RepID=A0A026WTB2_OOCBI|nr:putative fatty acyl-CoA reductase CG5065 [Ooceraea biroi]EZA59252.1 Putative fatty acyl-CoA reductase [Ooceraea biroi]RLU19596.1 hypothetical protein DMN91_008153 [Ooceraea biroi]
MGKSNLSEIQSFYKDKTIFITGASGFMGKVLLEKLLYSCSDLDKIYILLRNKRGRSFDNRLEDIFKLPLFQRVRNEKPETFKKVIPLQGDLSLENLGLTKEQRERLINEVHLVFNYAATLRLEAKLKDAVEMNLVGTERVLELVKQMKRLQLFVHLSTAFCHIDQEELGERVYDSTDDPKDIIRLIQWLDEDIIDLITPKLLHPHPNTYTYTKRLGETLVAREYPNLPCCIVRPAIVIPSYTEPIPGWVDNLNGPTGLLVGGGKGVIRSMHCNGDYHAQVIPVDVVTNAMIAVAYTLCNTKEEAKNIPVYNMTQSSVLEITWREVLDRGKEVLHEYPFEGQIWYPDGNIRSNIYVHNLFVFFFHIIPAYLIDFLMIIFRQKRFMVRIQKRISLGLQLLQYFTTREWIFHSEKIIALQDTLSPVDQKLFPFVFYDIDINEYLKHLILGSRQYCMKEDLSTLPRARRHQKIMFIIHNVAVYLFYFGILYLVYKQFETVRFCLDYGTEKMKLMPLVGGLMQKMHI